MGAAASTVERVVPVTTRAAAPADAARARFTAFYTRHHRDVVGLAYTLCGSWSAAEDIAQEAFVRAYRDWRKVGEYARPDSWVKTVAVNLATSRGRRLTSEAKALARLGGRREIVATDPLPEDADAFWSAVRSLPRRQAQAVALRYHADLPIADIAQAMGCAEGTVKAALHAARQTLATQLDREAAR
jgi:RNA polymerase sigma-70 factor, ECF subfamily